MTHGGDERRNPTGGMPGVPGVMTFGTAAAGEVLVNRYRLEDHIDTDTAGRQIWRGMDTVLRRQVALVIREPGGEAAASMLAMAVAASRLVHPHIVSVYDAVDEGERAYLIREWVPGVALRDVLTQAPLDSERATLVTHAIAEAVSALHSAGIVHGNIHPGTVLIADDGRVVLMDAHADAPTDPEYDVRAIGAVLYACLTGHWPYAEAGRSALPDAPRDSSGRIIRPRQVRPTVPRNLDEIAYELLDPTVEPPPATALATEFARLATDDEYNEGYDGGYDNHGYDGQGYDGHDDHSSGPMGFADHGGGSGRKRGGKLLIGIIVLAVIAITGAIIGTQVLSSPDPTPTEAGGPAAPASSGSTPSKPITLTATQIRVVDPPSGDRTEFEGFEQMVDNNEQTGWSTDEYNQTNFGSIKPGMGVLINLGAPTKVSAVKVAIKASGGSQAPSIALRTGTADAGNTTPGDDTISKDFTAVGAPQDPTGTNIVFPVDKATVQYLLIWVTKLPDNGEGKFQLTINEISVLSA